MWPVNGFIFSQREIPVSLDSPGAREQHGRQDGDTPSETETKSGQETPEEIRHSEQNILTWMTYLPQDCIEVMIRLGWDRST
jgi:hypothetical protein